MLNKNMARIHRPLTPTGFPGVVAVNGDLAECQILCPHLKQQQGENGQRIPVHIEEKLHIVQLAEEISKRAILNLRSKLQKQILQLEKKLKEERMTVLSSDSNLLNCRCSSTQSEFDLLETNNKPGEMLEYLRDEI